MATLASWANGSLPTVVGSGVSVVTDGGPESGVDALQFDQAASTASTAQWSFTATAGVAIRAYLRLPASWASSSSRIIGGRVDTANLSGAFNLSGSGAAGQVRLINSSGGTTVASSATGLVANTTWYRVELLIDGSGQEARLGVFALESDSPLYDSGWQAGTYGSTTALADVGPNLTTVTVPSMRAADILVVDSIADWVGRAAWDAGATNYTPTPTDSVGVTDAASTTRTSSRTVADNAGITDAVSAVIQAARTVTDAVGVDDTPGPQVLDIAEVVSDPAGISDSVAQLMAAARTIADAAGITDSVTVVLDRAIAADDPIGVTDSAGTALDAGRSAVDAAGVGDQVTVTLVAARAVGDPIGVIDSVTAVLTAAGEALVSDPAGIADEVTVSITSARGLADAAALTDSVLAVLSATAATDDQVATSDSVGAITVAVRTVTDGVAIVDTVTATLTRAELPNTPPGRRLTVEYESRTLYVRAGR